MRRYFFRLSITAPRLLAYYRGQASVVSAMSTSGQRVQFAADKLRMHARHDGVHGRFELQASDQGRFLALNRIGD
ncbi:MAG: DUF2835 family protein [Gammaproteobacteria bacterium]|nr:DUF2835 family protein [Gammaproteobacteria bacterium]